MRAQAFLSVAIATVLFTAGAAKLAPGSGIYPFLVALSIPHGPARVVASAVPAIEIGTAVALVLAPGRLSVVAACVLSWAFVAVIGYAAHVGVTQSCRCFGAMDAGQVRTPVALIRAVVLALATLALLFMRPAAAAGAPGSIAGFTVAVLAGLTFVAAFGMVNQVWVLYATRPVAGVRSPAKRGPR